MIFAINKKCMSCIKTHKMLENSENGKSTIENAWQTWINRKAIEL